MHFFFFFLKDEERAKSEGASLEGNFHRLFTLQPFLFYPPSRASYVGLVLTQYHPVLIQILFSPKTGQLRIPTAQRQEI